MSTKPDVAVVGAGAIGAMTARELALAGLKVFLVDRAGLGRGASFAAGGILSPILPWNASPPVSALSEWGQRRFEALSHELHSRTGIDPEWTPSGALMLGIEPNGEARAWADRHDMELCELDPDGIGEVEPAAGAGWDTACLVPGMAQIRSNRFTAALAAEVRSLGVTVRERTAVRDIWESGGRVRGLKLDSGMVSAPNVVIAAGAWSAPLLAGHHVLAGMKPIRGQMLWYQLEPGTVRHMIFDGERYVIPRRDGVCLVGSTLEDVGYDESITDRALADIAESAGRLIPTLAERRPEGSWCGLRPSLGDDLPKIGQVPDTPGLYLNTGHYRNGINLAPGSARLVTDLIAGNDPIVDPAPFAPTPE